MSTGSRVLLACVLCLIAARHGSAQQRDVYVDEQIVAYTNVNMIAMEADRIEPHQTVLVRGDRIAAVGSYGTVSIPDGAIRIDGAGRYLLPGLTDAHVHLADLPWAHNRPDFGDAPLYLANGVTTVVNLGGSAVELEWRRRIAAGELVGPTIYTSGPFLNEPRVKTAEETAREIEAQVSDGYDVIKFHELPGTTAGLALAAYRAMIDSALRLRIPLVGHAPVNLGVDAWLAAGQPVAHSGMLSNIYFLPMMGNLRVLLASATLVMLLVVLSALAAVGSRRARKASTAAAVVQGRWLVVAAAALSVVAALMLFAVLPGGPLFESVVLRALVTVCTALLWFATVWLLVVTARLWRRQEGVFLMRLHTSVSTIAAASLAVLLTAFWVPVAWRSTDAGITQFARRVRDAGISVQSTLVVYETFATPTRVVLQRDQAIDYLVPTTRDEWRRLATEGMPFTKVAAFNRKVVGALSREGTTILAGTDAMGIPLIPPGTSLHRELALLCASGLTPYQAIRAATVAPAKFLEREHEFGTIAVGKRADLLLVDDNPLEDIGRLNAPAGVMVRGRWLPRAQLEQMLARLKN